MLSTISNLVRLQPEVLGINARNLRFVYPMNRRKHLHQVNNKLITKQLLDDRGVPTPPTLAVFRSLKDLKTLRRTIDRLSGFAVKPAMGSGGRGILVIRRDAFGRLVAPSRGRWTRIDATRVHSHLIHILSGLYSLEHLGEVAYLEQLLVVDETLGELARCGIPDVRVIVHDGRPIMAMLRIPTCQSAGKANLHQGAVAFGIKLETGRTSFAIWKSHVVTRHPDTGHHLPRIQIPHWDDILNMALRAASCTALGYLGVDIVIDRQLGPMVIELNARPGLSIQLANRKGLLSSLQKV